MIIHKAKLSNHYKKEFDTTYGAGSAALVFNKIFGIDLNFNKL